PWKIARACVSWDAVRQTGFARDTCARRVPSGAGSGSSSIGRWFASSPSGPTVTSVASPLRRIRSWSTGTRSSLNCAGRYMAHSSGGQMIDYGRFEVLTFDCYGTLIDWETGILTAGRAAVAALACSPAEALLPAFAALEAEAEVPYRPYRQVLALCLRGLGARFGVPVDDASAAAFADSVGHWPPFPDSPAALRALQGR